tara:strand:- start:106 stop:294 length:189 start_codon:yes stop_codon:yes gene_type:complete
MRKFRIQVIELYTFEKELILNAANEKDLQSKVQDMIDSKRRRMRADDAEVIAVELLEEIVQH